MASTVKKFCSLFRCCTGHDSLIWSAGRIQREATTKLLISRRGSKQKQELLDLLFAYQRVKHLGMNVTDWALQAAQNGALLGLLNASLRLAGTGDFATVELVCINAALVTCFLQDNTETETEFFEPFVTRFQGVLQRKENGRLGAELVLLTLLRIQNFRKYVIKSQFFLSLFSYYQSLVSRKSYPYLQSSRESNRIPESKAFEEPVSDEDISEASSIAEQSITSESRHNESPKTLPVPKLDLSLSNTDSSLRCAAPAGQHYNDSAIGTWSDRWKSGRHSGKYPPLSNHRYLSSHNEKLRSRRSHRGGGCGKSSESLTVEDGNSSNNKIKSFFASKKTSHHQGIMDDDLKGLRMIIQDLGLTKTISFLRDQQHDSNCSLVQDEFLDLGMEWSLQKDWIHDSTLDVMCREKIAFLEIFLLLASVIPPSCNLDPCQTILNDLLRSLQINSQNEVLLHHSIAVFLEYSLDKKTEEKTIKEGYVQIRNTLQDKDQVDELLKMLIHEMHKLTSISRPDMVVYKRLDQVLNMTVEYLLTTPLPIPTIQNLIYPLSLLRSMFVSQNKVEEWRHANLNAFSSLLILYIEILESFDFTQDSMLCKELLRGLMSEEWINILKDLSWWLLQGQIRWLQHDKRLRINIYIWSFFTAVAEAQFKLRDSIDSGLQFEDFSSLLTPRVGLVSKTLVILDQAKETDEELFPQVLKFLQASCFLVESSLIDHEMEFDCYVRYLTYKFMKLYELGAMENKIYASLMSLLLQVIITTIVGYSSQASILLVSLGLVELVINDLEGLKHPLSTLQMTNPLLVQQQQYTSVEAYQHHDRTNPSRNSSSKSKSVKSYCEGEGMLLRLSQSSFSSTPPNYEREGIMYSLTEEPQSASNQYTDMPVDELDKELFGEKQEDESNILSSTESWPSDLQPTGDMDEDTLRLELYMLRKDYQRGLLTLEEYEKRTAETQLEFQNPSEEEDITSVEWEQDSESSDEEVVEAPAQSSPRVPCFSVQLPFLAPISSDRTTTQRTLPPLDTAQELKDSQPDEETTVNTGPMTQSLHLENSSSCPDVKTSSSQLVQNSEVYISTLEFLLHVLLMLDKNLVEESNDLALKLSRVLFRHINDHHFTPLVPRLLQRAQERGPDSFRILRLLLDGFFDISLYHEVDRIYKGEVAHVKRCSLTKSGEGLPELCIVKVIDFPLNYQRSDVSILHLYSEVTVMEKLRNEPGFCQIYDYGFHGDTAYIVMENCQCSLQDWIRDFPSSSPWAVRLVLRIFKAVAERVAKLHEMKTVHFDLKCSNILLKIDTTDSEREEKDWKFPATENPPFEIVLADFGSSRCYQGQQVLATVRNRGTESCKAPEMLQIRGSRKRRTQSQSYGRREAAGAPSDVWSLGCLLFELLTGEMLYSGQEWARFYTQVTQEGCPLFAEDKIQLLNESYRMEIEQLLGEILVRDQQKRPPISHIIQKVDQLLEGAVLPAYQPPYFPLSSSSLAHSLNKELHTIKSEEREDAKLCSFIQEKQFSIRLHEFWISVFFFTNDQLILSDLNDFFDVMVFTHRPPPLGVICIESTNSASKDSIPGTLKKRMRQLVMRTQVEAFYFSLEALKEDFVLKALLETLTKWDTTSGGEGKVLLCLNEDIKREFLQLFLHIIKIFDDCSCLQALSKLKGRISHGI